MGQQSLVGSITVARGNDTHTSPPKVLVENRSLRPPVSTADSSRGMGLPEFLHKTHQRAAIKGNPMRARLVGSQHKEALFSEICDCKFRSSRFSQNKSRPNNLTRTPETKHLLPVEGLSALDFV